VGLAGGGLILKGYYEAVRRVNEDFRMFFVEHNAAAQNVRFWRKADLGSLSVE
jgi:hypothetical protein